jgi:hypothetical protein
VETLQSQDVLSKDVGATAGFDSRFVEAASPLKR